MSKQGPYYDVDMMRKIHATAGRNVLQARVRAREQFWQPDVDRNDLEEYMRLTQADHAALIMEMGQDAYNEYVTTMERLRRKYGY